MLFTMKFNVLLKKERYDKLFCSEKLLSFTKNPTKKFLEGSVVSFFVKCWIRPHLSVLLYLSQTLISVFYDS